MEAAHVHEEADGYRLYHGHEAFRQHDGSERLKLCSRNDSSFVQEQSRVNAYTIHGHKLQSRPIQQVCPSRIPCSDDLFDKAVPTMTARHNRVAAKVYEIATTMDRPWTMIAMTMVH